jgi:hypothetical protein
VRPARKVLKPGETFQLKAVILDASGCRVSQTPTWATPDGAKLTVSAAGLVSVAADAPEGAIVLSAGVNGRAAKVTIEVVSSDHYDKLLAAGGLRETDEAAVVTVTTASLGGSTATAEDNSKKRRLVFLAIVGACVSALGIVGLVLWRRQKPEVEEVEELVPGETKMTVVRKKRLVAKPRPGGAVRCPTCSRDFPAGSVFCPHDGGKLAPPGVQPAPAPAVAGKVCPVCGMQYGPNAQFCGKEGATLVARTLDLTGLSDVHRRERVSFSATLRETR